MAMQRHDLAGRLRHLVRIFWSRFGMVVLAGGLALTGIGLWIQFVRWNEVNAAEQGARPASPDRVVEAAAVAHRAVTRHARGRTRFDQGADEALSAFKASGGPSTSAPDPLSQTTSSLMAVAPTAPPTPTALPLGPPEGLVIPAIGLSTRVMPVGWTAKVIGGRSSGNEWQTADFAAGYHVSSALLGAVGNTVLSGHNNILGEVFRDLHLLKAGDRIIVSSGRAERTYAVSENFVVKEAGATPAQRRANAAWIAPTPDERLTLVTCYPPWSNTHRTIIVAFPVPDGDAPLPRDAVLAR